MVASDLVAMLRTRIELFSAECAEQKHRLVVLAALIAAAMLFLLLAVILASILVIAFFWSTEYRYLAIGSLTAVYAVLGLGLAWLASHRLRTQATPFAATMEELSRDVVALGALSQSLTDGFKDKQAGGHHE